MTRLMIAAATMATMAAMATTPLFAAPASADDASYLAKLNQSGVPIPVSNQVRLSTGHYLCGRLGISAPKKDLVRELTHTFFYDPAAAQVQIDAAQSELCPQTLAWEK
ncbi:MAG TPA: DUF732 domain-containing protein [Mycobacterium sp.]|nr:DUF732 domain-containing protein [Mycobacterium sp.]